MQSSENPSVEEAVGKFSFRIKLARASELALAGRLFRAKELLMPNGHLPQTPEELDLLARILLQEKRYKEARKRWRDAFDLSGGKHEYQHAIDILDNYLNTLRFKNKILIIANVISYVMLIIYIVYRFIK